jgi:hypothetical protein
MADAQNLIVTGDSHQAVTYVLLLGIAKEEKKNIFFQGGTPTVHAEADWLLATYVAA